MDDIYNKLEKLSEKLSGNPLGEKAKELLRAISDKELKEIVLSDEKLKGWFDKDRAWFDNNNDNDNKKIINEFLSKANAYSLLKKTNNDNY